MIERYNKAMSDLCLKMIILNLATYRNKQSIEARRISKNSKYIVDFGCLDYLPCFVMLVNFKKSLYEELTKLIILDHKWKSKFLSRFEDAGVRAKVEVLLTFPELSDFEKTDKDADTKIIKLDLVKLEEYLRGLEEILSEIYDKYICYLYSALGINKTDGFPLIDFEDEYDEEDTDERTDCILKVEPTEFDTFFERKKSAYAFYKGCFLSIWAINNKKEYEFYDVEADVEYNWLNTEGAEIIFSEHTKVGEDNYRTEIPIPMPIDAWLNDSLSRLIYAEYSFVYDMKNKRKRMLEGEEDSEYEGMRKGKCANPLTLLNTIEKIENFSRHCLKECGVLFNAFVRVIRTKRFGFSEETVETMLKTTYNALHKAYVLKALEFFKGRGRKMKDKEESGIISNEDICNYIGRSNSYWSSIVNNLYSEKCFTDAELIKIQGLIAPRIKDSLGIDIDLTRKLIAS